MFLGFFHEPTNIVMQRWISSKPVDVGKSKDNTIVDLNKHHHEQLTAQIHELKSALNEQIKRSELLQHSVVSQKELKNQIQQEIIELKSLGDKANEQTEKTAVTEPEPVSTQAQTQRANLTSTTVSTTSMYDKSDEIAELIAHLEARNKRRHESIATSTTPATQQAEPVYKHADNIKPLTHDFDFSDKSSSSFWKSTVDLHQGYTISVYSVMAVLSVLTILLLVYLLFKVVKWFMRRLFSGPTCVIVKPEMFTEGKDVISWLKQFEMYADATMSADPFKRGNCLLLSLDDKSRSHVKQYNSIRNKKIEYTSLKECMISLFKSKEKTSRQHMQLFLSRLQAADETIPKYYTELCELVVKAFPTIPESAREDYVFQQLASGVSNTKLRDALFQDYNNRAKLRDILADYSQKELISMQGNSITDSNSLVNINISNETIVPNSSPMKNDSAKTVNAISITSSLTNTLGQADSIKSVENEGDDSVLPNEQSVQYVRHNEQEKAKRLDPKLVTFKIPSLDENNNVIEVVPRLMEIASTLVKQQQALTDAISKQNQDIVNHTTNFNQRLSELISKQSTTVESQCELLANTRKDNNNPFKNKDDQFSTQQRHQNMHAHYSKPHQLGNRQMQTGTANQQARQLIHRPSQQHSQQSSLQTKNVQHVEVQNQIRYDCGLVNTNNKIRYSIKDDALSLNEISGTLKINGLAANFIADTGCNQTVVHERVFRRNGTMDSIQLTPSTVKVTTANGEELAVTGSFNCDIEIGNTICNTDVLVVPELSRDTLLGIEVLSTNPQTSKYIHAMQKEFSLPQIESNGITETVVKLNNQETLQREDIVIHNPVGVRSSAYSSSNVNEHKLIESPLNEQVQYVNTFTEPSENTATCKSVKDGFVQVNPIQQDTVASKPMSVEITSEQLQELRTQIIELLQGMEAEG